MYKIIGDSCTDIPEEYRESVTLVPLKITVGDRVFVDDAAMDVNELLRAMKASPVSPVTACPSPAEYADAMYGDDDVFCITLSTHLSGSYQSALAGADIKKGSGRVHVFDSKSAASGQGLIVHHLKSLIGQGLPFDEIVRRMNAFIDGMSTYFVLQSLENLIKAGRMNRLVGQVASILHMRPIMGDDNGKIVLVEKARGTPAAMAKLVDRVINRTNEIRDAALRQTAFIAHCNCMDRALGVKEEILRRSNLIKDVIIVKTGGLSTCYANDGGIIVAY